MCLGIPMRVIGFQGAYAIAERENQSYLIDTQLIEQPKIGEWLLTFLDTAREIISEEQAELINNALQALTLTLNGETQIEHLFADLINREPQLPEFLREYE